MQIRLAKYPPLSANYMRMEATGYDGALVTQHALFLLPLLRISISIHTASNFQNNCDGGAKVKLRPSSIDSGLT